MGAAPSSSKMKKNGSFKDESFWKRVALIYLTKLRYIVTAKFKPDPKPDLKPNPQPNPEPNPELDPQHDP